ncbi:MAG: division/cell wall cluster transcriptional repressor MraZ [Eggerthellaceae bacterium]
MAGLHGEFRHKLDAKGRLSLPAAFRKVLAKNLMVTLSPKGECLYVFEPEGFDEWVKSLFDKDGGFQASNSVHINQRKVLNSRAIDIEVDASNRIGISPTQREAAGLDKEVILIGDTDHFEIWDAKRWDDFCSSVVLDTLFV